MPLGASMGLHGRRSSGYGSVSAEVDRPAEVMGSESETVDRAVTRLRPTDDVGKGNVRLAILATHPVQYHTPLYQELTGRSEIDLQVFYLDRTGLEGVYDETFKTAIVWDIPLLEGHRFAFIRNYAVNRVSGFFSRVNPGIVHVLKRRKYDVVLIQGYALLSCWIAFVAARSQGIPIIWRGEVVSRTDSRVKHQFSQRVKSFLARAMLTRCAAVLYTCSGNRIFLERHGVPTDRLFPFLCAVDNAYFRSQYDIHKGNVVATRAELGIAGGDMVVTYCGRLVAGKRVRDIVEAIASTNIHGIVLLVLGDGPDREALEVRAQEAGVDMRCVGFVNQSALGRYYSISDVFMMVSEIDRSPKSLNEAMSFELPAIVSDGVGTAEDVIIEGKTGHVVRVGDISAMATHLGRLWAQPQERRDMGRAAGEHVCRFTFTGEVEGLIDACRHAAGQA